MRVLFVLTKILLVVFILSCVIKLASAYLFGPKSFNNETDWLQGNNIDNQQQKDTKSKDDSSGENTRAEVSRESKANTGEIDKEPDAGRKGESMKPNDTKNSDSDKKEYFLTLNDINSIENISVVDKIKGFSILNKLKKDDFKKVFQIARGGITMGEMKECMQILENNLNQKDIAALNEILLKNKKQYVEGN